MLGKSLWPQSNHFRQNWFLSRPCGDRRYKQYIEFTKAQALCIRLRCEMLSNSLVKPSMLNQHACPQGRLHNIASWRYPHYHKNTSESVITNPARSLSNLTMNVSMHSTTYQISRYLAHYIAYLDTCIATIRECLSCVEGQFGRNSFLSETHYMCYIGSLQNIDW